jgi:hypothetical protein
MNGFLLELPAFVPLGKVIRSALLVTTLMIANFFLPLLLSEKLPSFISPAGLVVKFFDWLYIISPGLWMLYILAVVVTVVLGAWSVLSFLQSSRTFEWYVKLGRMLIMALVAAKMYSVFVFADKLFVATLEGDDASLTVIVLLVYKHLVMMGVIPDLVVNAIKFLKRTVKWQTIASVMVVIIALNILTTTSGMWLLASEVLLVTLTEFVREKVQDDMYDTFIQACININTARLGDWLERTMEWLKEPTDATLAETLQNVIVTTRQTVTSTDEYLNVAKRALCIGETWMNNQFALTYRSITVMYILFAVLHNNTVFIVVFTVVVFGVYVTTENLAQVSAHPVPKVIIDSVVRANSVVYSAMRIMLTASVFRGGVTLITTLKDTLVAE